MSTIKTVDAYSRLVGLCTGFGGKYNPGQQNLKLKAMRALLEKAQSSLQDVKSKTNAYKHITNERELAFADVDQLASQITFTLKAAGVPKQTLDDARYYFRLIGRRLKSRAPVPAVEGEEQPLRARRFTQGSYVARANNLGKLVDLVSTLPEYVPNEEELQTEQLQAKVDRLHELNKAVALAKAARSQAISHRNKVLYDDVDSMVDNASRVKSYVRVVYGHDSDEMKLVVNLSFTKPYRS
jgi:hypothetical protein